MINEIFHKYQNTINNASGSSAIQFREQNGTLGIEIKIVSFSGNPIIPSLPIEKTNFSITLFDTGLGRIKAIDNFDNDKILHEHEGANKTNISGSYTLTSIASYALEFFR